MLSPLAGELLQKTRPLDDYPLIPIGTVLGVFTILQLAQSDMYDRLEGRAE